MTPDTSLAHSHPILCGNLVLGLLLAVECQAVQPLFSLACLPLRINDHPFKGVLCKPGRAGGRKSQRGKMPIRKHGKLGSHTCILSSHPSLSSSFFSLPREDFSHAPHAVRHASAEGHVCQPGREGSPKEARIAWQSWAWQSCCGAC